MEARLAHPAFDPFRHWLERLEDPLRAGAAELTVLAEEAGIQVASGAPLRFVEPATARRAYGHYELSVLRSGCVETRPGSLHDLFNALAWLAYPKTKAKLNQLHVEEIAREEGRRGRFRDLLTLLDEGGAIIRCSDPALASLVHAMRWKELFWDHRPTVVQSMQIHVLGHAVLERALAPWPGITCKALFVDGPDADAQAAAAIGSLPRSATPRSLPPFPVFGYPGWHPGSEQPAFYEDGRYFRTCRPRDPPARATR